MPVPFEQPPSGTILVHEAEPSTTNAVALYARVSSADPKADLDRQIARRLGLNTSRRLWLLKADEFSSWSQARSRTIGCKT